jgi:hypothetical protein
MQTEKKCGRCHEIKPRDNYSLITNKYKTREGITVKKILRSYCKSCIKELNNDYRKKNYISKAYKRHKMSSKMKTELLMTYIRLYH